MGFLRKIKRHLDRENIHPLGLVIVAAVPVFAAALAFSIFIAMLDILKRL